LFTTPVIYLYFDRLAAAVRRRRARAGRDDHADGIALPPTPQVD
jgi:hypothetical protein